MVCQLNEMLCKQAGVRPHTANIAIIFVGLIEIIVRINVFQDLDVYKYCFILKNHYVESTCANFVTVCIYARVCVSCVLVSACSLLFAVVLFHIRSSLVVTNARKRTPCYIHTTYEFSNKHFTNDFNYLSRNIRKKCMDILLGK